MSDYLTRAEIIVLVDERIEKHDESVNEPKHESNTKILGEMQSGMSKMSDSLIRMEATQSVVMKFAGAGVLIWSIRQIVELVQTFKH